MEEQSVYHVLPDSPISVLEMFGTSKKQINSFCEPIIEGVKSGNVSAKKIKILSKTLKEISEILDKETKDEQIREASFYGDKPFMFMGAELHLTSVYTSYDYSNCGYSDWNKYNNEITNLKEKLKECETFLRGLRAPIEILNNETGEVEIVTLPTKSVTEGLKVSIK